MSDNPPADAEQWAKQAVEAFGAGYEGRTDEYPCTLAAFRSESQVTATFEKVVEALKDARRGRLQLVVSARSSAQSFTNDKDCFDIKDFALCLAKVAARDTGRRRSQRRIWRRRSTRRRSTRWRLGPTVRKATGLAFWCPGSNSSFNADVETYERPRLRRAHGLEPLPGRLGSWTPEPLPIAVRRRRRKRANPRRRRERRRLGEAASARLFEGGHLAIGARAR